MRPALRCGAGPHGTPALGDVEDGTATSSGSRRDAPGARPAALSTRGRRCRGAVPAQRRDPASQRHLVHNAATPNSGGARGR